MAEGNNIGLIDATNRVAVHLGEYSCKGYDIFGPFKLIGGIAKGYPNANDLQKARAFYQIICKPGL